MEDEVTKVFCSKFGEQKTELEAAKMATFPEFQRRGQNKLFIEVSPGPVSLFVKEGKPRRKKKKKKLKKKKKKNGANCKRWVHKRKKTE